MIRDAFKLSCAALLLSLFACLPANASDPYPSRPIRILVGFAAGGPADVPARYVANKLTEALGNPVVVENKPGAAGMLAVSALLSQPNDGYTLLLCTHYDSINTALHKTVKYRVEDFAPIGLMSRYYQVAAIANKIPAESMKQFIDYAKAHPGQLNYGSLGPGSTQEIAARLLGKLAHIQMAGISFRGAAPAMQEVVAGRIDLFIGPPITVMPLYKAKQVKVIGVAAPERFQSAPEVPTFSEMGLPIISSGWLGLCAATGTPTPVIDRLNKELKAVVATEGFRTLVETTGSTAVSSSPAELTKIIRDTATETGALIREFGMQIE